jgi:hypothetical protein
MTRNLAGFLLLICGVAGCTTVDTKNTMQVVVPVIAAQRPVASPAVAPTAGGILPCAAEDRAVTRTGPGLPVRYENHTSGTVSIFWLNPAGMRVPYETIEAGKSVMRPGSATSYWVVTNAQQTCIGIVNPGSSAQTIVVREVAGAASGAGLVAPQSVALAVPGNTDRRLDAARSLNEDCSSVGKTVVKIAPKPAHGVAEIRYVDGYPNYPASNPRSACNKRAVAGVELWYRPEAGYAGDDSLSVDYFPPEGREFSKSYFITVN